MKQFNLIILNQAAGLHTTCIVNAHSQNVIYDYLISIQEKAYLDEFVEKHVKIALSSFIENMGSDITMTEVEDLITTTEAEDIARTMIKDAIKSGELDPFDNEELTKMLDRIPKGLLDIFVEDAISELENNPQCREELTEFDTREELIEYVKRE